MLIVYVYDYSVLIGTCRFISLTNLTLSRASAASDFLCGIGRVVTPSHCLFVCIIGTSCDIVLTDI